MGERREGRAEEGTTGTLWRSLIGLQRSYETVLVALWLLKRMQPVGGGGVSGGALGANEGAFPVSSSSVMGQCENSRPTTASRYVTANSAMPMDTNVHTS